MKASPRVLLNWTIRAHCHTLLFMWARETELGNPHLCGEYLPAEPISVMSVDMLFYVGIVSSPHPPAGQSLAVLLMLALNS